MATIRFAPKLVKSHDGFDFAGRPTTLIDAMSTIRSIVWNKRNTDATYVYNLQKFNAKTVVTTQLTKSGKVSKKAPVVNKVPAHWEFKVYEIPADVVKSLKLDGKKIVQHKHHWEIVAI